MNSATDDNVAIQSELSLLNVLFILMNNSDKQPVFLLKALQIEYTRTTQTI